MKANERSNSEDMTRRIDAELHAARAKLNIEKLRCDSVRLCILGRRLPSEGIGGLGDLETQSQIAKLVAAIERRARGTEYDSAGKFIPSVLLAATQVRSGVDRDASIALFGEAALRLAQAFHPEKSSADLLNEIVAAVAVSRARRNGTAIGAQGIPGRPSSNAAREAPAGFSSAQE
jgi:hypothetical protein